MTKIYMQQGKDTEESEISQERQERAYWLFSS